MTEPTDTRSESGMLDARYRLVRELARGGMSVVHLAEQAAVDRLVAVKILRPPREVPEGYDFEGRFREEARALASFQHPNIVVLHDFGMLSDGRVYLAMEYLDGPRLSQVLRTGPLAPRRALRLLLGVGEALRYAHHRGVVHRDVSPGNVIVLRDAEGGERVKLIDFGIAESVEGGSTDADGLIVGSPSCMAPEQIRGEAVDARADVYGFGVLLYRCVAGAWPFRGADTAATLRAHLEEPVPTLASKARGETPPPELERIVGRALQKDPRERYADMDALLTDLRHALEGLEAPMSVEPDPEPPRRSPLVWASGVLVGLALLAGGAWTLSGGAPEPGDAEPEIVAEEGTAPAVSEAADPVEVPPEGATPPSPAPGETPEPVDADPVEPPEAGATEEEDPHASTRRAARPTRRSPAARSSSSETEDAPPEDPPEGYLDMPDF